MSGSAKASDGKPYPLPRILVSRREQRPHAFGWQPVAQPEEGPRVALHTGRPLAASLVTRELGGPLPCDWTAEGAPMLTADYTLRHPEHGRAMDELILIERKSRDLASSLTHGHDRLLAECKRMAGARFKYLIADSTSDDLIEGRCGCGTRVKAMVHCLESIAMKHDVQVRLYKGAAWAEYVTALVLQRAWRGYLETHPESLRCARASEADLPAPGLPAGMMPIAQQYRSTGGAR